jgi:hypothetical protein
LERVKVRALDRGIVGILVIVRLGVLDRVKVGVLIRVTDT